MFLEQQYCLSITVEEGVCFAVEQVTAQNTHGKSQYGSNLLAIKASASVEWLTANYYVQRIAIKEMW
jgi:hypothetical protein